jgi:hypothetical protein
MAEPIYTTYFGFANEVHVLPSGAVRFKLKKSGAAYGAGRIEVTLTESDLDFLVEPLGLMLVKVKEGL